MLKKCLPVLLMVLVLFFGINTITYTQELCGDVDGNGWLDLNDLILLFKYVYGADIEPPVNIGQGDVDPFPGIDVGDVTYIIAYFYEGGAIPCGGVSEGENLPGGEVSLDRVTGLLGTSEIITDYYTKFHIRFNNDTDEIFRAISNGFKVYSPDGANIGIHDFYATDYLTENVFIYPYHPAMIPDVYDPEAFGWYGWYQAYGPGIDPGSSDIAFIISLDPFSVDDVGKTVCLDSVYYGNGGAWKWQVDELSYYNPTWDGPHCYTITELGENPPIEMEVSPDTVYITTSQIEEDPTSLAFYVTDSAMCYFRFTSTESCSWFDVDKPSAVAPDWVYINVDTSGLAYGIYYDSVIVEADNALPKVVYVQFTHVDADPCWYEVVEGDSLIFPSVTVNACDGVQPVVLKLVNRIAGATIPIAAPPEITIKDVSFEGLVTEDWDLNVFRIQPDSNYVLVGLINTKGYFLDLGSTTVMNIIFDYNEADCGEGDKAKYFRWDTTLSDDPSRSLQFATNCTSLPTDPQFDPNRDVMTIDDIMPGDFQANGELSISDLTAFVNYLFDGGPAPFLMNAMDLNRDCEGPNISDLTFMVDYLFLGGAAPECGCLGESSTSKIITSMIRFSTRCQGEETFIQINSPINLRGIHLQLNGDSHTILKNMHNNNLELVQGTNNGVLNIGYLDLDGGEIIGSGNHTLFCVKGEYSIESAVVSDINHTTHYIETSAKSGTLPNEYALFQNYPNPFNPRTTLRFSLRDKMDYELSIYNVLGQQVVSFKGIGDAGMNEITWDASSFASGMYLYRLNAGTFIDTKKMMLLK